VFPGISIREPGLPGWMSFGSERVNYGQNIRILSEPGMNVLTKASRSCKLYNSPLVGEGASHQQTTKYLTVIENLVMDIRWVFNTMTDWPN
jgi:hypothetical protein